MEKGGKGRLLEGTFIVFADEGGREGSALAAVRKRGGRGRRGRRAEATNLSDPWIGFPPSDEPPPSPSPQTFFGQRT